MNVRDDETKYGVKAIDTLAVEVGFDRSTVYRAATVASCWTAEEVKALVAAPTANDRAIGWSHLELLAALTPERREVLLAEVREKGLSVRELKAVIKGPPRKRSNVALRGDANDVYLLYSKLRRRRHQIESGADPEDAEAILSEASLRDALLVLRAEMDRLLDKLPARVGATNARKVRSPRGDRDPSERSDNSAPRLALDGGLE